MGQISHHRNPMNTLRRARRVSRVLSRLLALAMAASLMPLSLWAADRAAPLSLPQLLNEARRANPDLLAARKRWEAAQAKVPLAGGLPAPRIGVEFEDIPKGTVKFSQATAMYQLLQSIPFPGKLSLRKQVAAAEAQMAAAGFKQVEWDVLSQVKAAYYDLFLIDRQLEIQAQQVLWLEQAVTSARARYASGTAAGQTELLMAQAEALEASNNVTVLQHRREALAAHLNHLLNRPVHSAVGAAAPPPITPVAFTPEELLRLADAAQPELQVFKFAAERAQTAWRLSKRELLPDLETMFELRNPAMGPVGPWDLTLALTLPFWFWTKLRYGVRVALRDRESAEAAYQAMRNEIAKRIHEHWHEAAAAYASARIAREGLLPLARQAAESALAGYRSGRGSFLEVTAALQQVSRQQREYAQRLVELEQHVVMLEEASGIPLRPEHEVSATGGRS